MVALLVGQCKRQTVRSCLNLVVEGLDCREGFDYFGEEGVVLVAGGSERVVVEVGLGGVMWREGQVVLIRHLAYTFAIIDELTMGGVGHLDCIDGSAPQVLRWRHRPPLHRKRFLGRRGPGAHLDRRTET